MHGLSEIAPIFIFILCALGVAVVLLVIARIANPERAGRVKSMPYESGMDPIHDTRRRFDVRFHLLAIAFLVFDVELLFLYPWAAATRPYTPEVPAAAAATDADAGSPSHQVPASQADAVRSGRPLLGIDAAVASGALENRHWAFGGAMAFLVILTVGFIYDWRKGIFRWR